MSSSLFSLYNNNVLEGEFLIGFLDIVVEEKCDGTDSSAQELDGMDVERMRTTLYKMVD